LCLAQGLKKSGISVAVYERDASARFRNKGYRISIKQDGTRALRDCLPENLFRLCAVTAIRTATLLTLLDQQLTQKFAKPIPTLEPIDSEFGVNRLTLREILLADLDGIVHFGKTFERFHTVADGRVSAHFADGTSATGDLLVGADGTNSVVRDLMVPDARIDDLDYAIYGKTPITPGMMEWVPEILVDSFTRIVSSDGTGMGLATCRTREPVSVATAKFAPALHLAEMKGYFSWTPSLTDERYRDADGPTLHRLARGMVKEWHPALRRLVDEADVSATFPVSINSARPVEQ
jgi:2-polyprenyl-6-methoxyphenol hydroxylase-like FAD-dependent oxidoreductase